MDAPGTRVSVTKSTSSTEDVDWSNSKDNTRISFECPPRFQEVEFAAEGEPLYLEDIKGSTELWFIRTPHDFDAKRLNVKNASLSGRHFLEENEEADISYELHASQNTLSDKGLPHLLLPSRNGAKLVPAPTFKGKLSVVETGAIPPVLLPPSPPKRSNELPPGLKQRFMPFGWEEPKKHRTEETKQSSDTTDNGVRKTKTKKKKKSHKHKESTQESVVASSLTDANTAARQDDTEGEERLLGEDEKTGGDEEDGREVKKEHRKSKKRKRQDAGQREDTKAQEISEEIPQKKKKKKHKNLITG